MLADEEHDLLRLAVELDRLDPSRQLVRRRGVGNLPPRRSRRSPDGGSVALDEVGGTAVVGSLGEKDAHRLPVRIEAVIRRQERVDQDDLGVRLEPHDRNLLGPVFRWLPVRVRREPPRQLAHAGQR